MNNEIEAGVKNYSGRIHKKKSLIVISRVTPSHENKYFSLKNFENIITQIINYNNAIEITNKKIIVTTH